MKICRTSSQGIAGINKPLKVTRASMPFAHVIVRHTAAQPH
jgi:hypothetical protein